MGQSKEKLKQGKPVFGGWMLIGHPWIAELMAGEGFDWICVDMEHSTIGHEAFQNIALAVKGSGCDLLARLHSCDPVQAKFVLDTGADGIIVPMINSRAQAEQAVAMARFQPAGLRGVSVSRATDYGRNFKDYTSSHNEKVIVVVMLEHIEGAENADDILSIPGIDAAFIGPYDLSASMGTPGELNHPDVCAAQEKIIAACRKHGVAPGIHVVAPSAEQLRQRLDEGYSFIACSSDILMIPHGCRTMLEGRKAHG